MEKELKELFEGTAIRLCKTASNVRIILEERAVQRVLGEPYDKKASQRHLR